MKILVDVNVFEDVFRRRSGWEASLGVVGCVGANRASGFVSALTPALLYFLRRRTLGEGPARRAVRSIVEGFVVVPLDGEALDAVVTRNKRHFTQKDITVLTPEQLLDHLGLV